MQHVFLYRWQRMRRVKLGVRYLFLIEKTHTFLISVGDPAQLFSLQVLSVHRFLSPIGPLPMLCSVATDWTSPTSFINSQCKPVPFSRTKRRGEGTEAQRPCAGSFLQEAHGGPNFTFGNSLPQNLDGMSRSETKVVASVCHEMGLYKRNPPSQRVRWLPDAQTEGTAGLGQNCFKEKNTLRLVQCSSDGGSALENYKGSRGWAAHCLREFIGRLSTSRALSAPRPTWWEWSFPAVSLLPLPPQEGSFSPLPTVWHCPAWTGPRGSEHRHCPGAAFCLSSLVSSFSFNKANEGPSWRVSWSKSNFSTIDHWGVLHITWKEFKGRGTERWHKTPSIPVTHNFLRPDVLSTCSKE